MTYEHIKSTLLIGLISLSIVLTWQLYTFQPEIALLDDNTSRYIPDSLNEEREERVITDVVVPEQIVVHKQHEYTMIPGNDGRFKQLYEKLVGTNINEVNLLATGPFPKHDDRGGIEIIFPAPVPGDVFLELFEIKKEEFSLPFSEVDRLFLYIDASEQVHMQILSSEEERVIEVGTTLSVKEFEETYLEKFDEFKSVTTVKEQSSYHNRLVESVYIPTEPVTVKRLSYAITPLSPEFYKQSLFTDPSSVKYYQQSDGEDSYTDGNRIIMMQNNGLFMDYINPVFIEPQERSSKHIVQTSYEYVNGHGGWTDEYRLLNWESSDIRDEATYLLHVNGLPVIQFDGQGDMALLLSRSGTQIVNYTRPLFELDSYPIDASQSIQLPSGEDVIKELNKQEFFNKERLSKVAVGYEMIMRNSSFVTMEPHWFISYGNRWQKVTFEEEEGGTNGLE
ncbi:YycH family regulatory protein [Halalkalibacter kiskunsagensis]|uniref:YycH family regulatory protein n=1 Tax=Halalkalibacter kiskunsagensis TaxID=1548599 RepID=A0ABV6KEB4_9BACI